MELKVEDRHSSADSNEVSPGITKRYGVQEETNQEERNQVETGQFSPNPAENPASPLPNHWQQIFDKPNTTKNDERLTNTSAYNNSKKGLCSESEEYLTDTEDDLCDTLKVEDRHSSADSNEVSLAEQKHYGRQEETNQGETNQDLTGQFSPNPPENQIFQDNRPARQLHYWKNKLKQFLTPFVMVLFVIYSLHLPCQNLEKRLTDDERLTNTSAYNNFKNGVFILIWHAQFQLWPLRFRFGHAALVMLDPYRYISFWPGVEGKIPIIGPGEFSQSIESDMRKEGGPPDCIYYTESLNNIEINNYNEINGYNAFTNNCCNVVYEALFAGGAVEYANPFYIWCPLILNWYCEKYYHSVQYSTIEVMLQNRSLPLL